MLSQYAFLWDRYIHGLESVLGHTTFTHYKVLKKKPRKIELIINVQIEIYFIKSYNFFLFINKKSMNVCITHISVK